MNALRLTVMTVFISGLTSTANALNSDTAASPQPKASRSQIGTPVERRVALYATELGVTGARIPEGEAIMGEFLKRTIELGGKPTLTKKDSRSWFKYNLKQGEKLEDVVVKYAKGCARLDEQCLTIIRSHNRSIDDPMTYVGLILLPQREVQFNAMIDYGDGFRVSQNDNETTYYVKRPIEESLKIVSDVAWWTPDVSSYFINNRIHFVKVVIED